MRTGFVVLGAVLLVVGAGAWVYVTNAASDCNTRPGQVAQTVDPDTRGQCRTASMIVNAAVVVAIGGIVVGVVGIAD